MLTWLFVAARIVANPVSNVFQKRLAQQSAHPLFVIAATHAWLTLACVAALAMRLTTMPLELSGDPAFWGNIGIASLLAVASNTLLVAALKASDLSVLGPINAYKSVLSLGIGIVLLGEVPTSFGLLGVLLILAGSYFVIDREQTTRRSAFRRFFQERGIQLRLAALVLSATEAVFLKRALLASSPLAVFVLWCALGLVVAAFASLLMLRGCVRQQIGILRCNWATYLWLAGTTGLMQFATLVTFGKLQVGYSLALFQLSTLLSVFLGYRYFQERNIGKRLVGSLIVVVGAVLIIMFGKEN